MYKIYFKRLFDILGATLLIICFSPIVLLAFLLLFAVNKGKVIFFQTRPGYNNIPFVIYKFKTMNDNVDENGNLLADDHRLTSIGKIIRGLSIDELLQLINVIKGDMSLVGPRPLLMEYLNRYTPSQARRHDVKPGITGWAQVNGRNDLSWDEKLKFDLEYVDNVSFYLDMKILLMTILIVLNRKGIIGQNNSTIV